MLLWKCHAWTKEACPSGPRVHCIEEKRVVMAPLLHKPSLSLAKQIFNFSLTFQIHVPLHWIAQVRRYGIKHSSMWFQTVLQEANIGCCFQTTNRYLKSSIRIKRSVFNTITWWFPLRVSPSINFSNPRILTDSKRSPWTRLKLEHASSYGSRIF